MLLGQISFSYWRLILAIFRKYPVPSTDNIFVFIEYVQIIEIHIFKQYDGVRTLCKTSKFIVYRFVSERKRQVVIEQTRFLSIVFLSSEYKLENVYSGVNFCGKSGYFRELIFAGRWKNRKN